MSEIQAELVSELEIPFFTYFKDQFWIIYYSHGYDIWWCIAATCVYVPSRSQTDRIELASWSYYTKYIDHGDGVNINHPLTQIDMHYSGLLASMQNTSYWNIPCLLVPRDTVVHVYDPHDFNSFCEKIPALDATIKNTVAQFAAIGVPLSDMGLCWALQVGIFNQADGTYKDVDLIVSGTEHYPAISSFFGSAASIIERSYGRSTK